VSHLSRAIGCTLSRDGVRNCRYHEEYQNKG
jgi:hypothetical protein